MAMLKSDLHPPRNGLNADPVLYGIAAGLAEMFPPVNAPRQSSGGSEGDDGGDVTRETSDQE